MWAKMQRRAKLDGDDDEAALENRKWKFVVFLAVEAASFQSAAVIGIAGAAASGARVQCARAFPDTQDLLDVQ